jgi:membrane protein
MKSFWQFLRATFEQWWGDNPFRLGASLAYYTVFSIAPIILIAIAIAGLFFDRALVQGGILSEINSTVGSQVGKAIGDVVQYSSTSPSTVPATIVSIIVLIVGATSVFAELQDALNIIWRVKAKADRPWWAALKDRFWSFTIVLGVGFLLLVSLVLSAGLAALTHFLADGIGSAYIGQAINWVFSLAVITLLFAMIYKILPDAHIAWTDVWVGAFITALLFNVGKYLISLYLAKSAWISAYGAAGSLIVILLWVYYSSQIFLFGAELTQVYARRNGKPIEPTENADRVTADGQVRHTLGRAGEQAATGV